MPRTFLAIASLACAFACQSTAASDADSRARACDAQGRACPAPRAACALAQATSLLGTALYPPPLTALAQSTRESQLEAAQRELEARPDDPEAWIWVGRRFGYLGRFREAIDTFTLGSERFPHDARFLRHRGHRWITVREFELAARDLERAAELERGKPDTVEPDGQPNAAGILLETLQSNIHYHLGLARFLQGDFERAEPAWRRCLELSKNDDNRCSATWWLCNTLRRLGREDDARAAAAAIRADMQIVEYDSYHALCLAHRDGADIDALAARARSAGPDASDFATFLFGAGHFALLSLDFDRARSLFEECTRGPSWHAFGSIAAEAELARLGSD
ncbi:MAG: tetratricopeptide repeat protein [Planctomycetes bacterium]|nr:tetratricopeptide repeat protein [Planctomycetota bacterium]